MCVSIRAKDWEISVNHMDEGPSESPQRRQKVNLLVNEHDFLSAAPEEERDIKTFNFKAGALEMKTQGPESNSV